MDDPGQGRRFAIILGVIVAIVAAFALRPVVREALAPTPQEAFAAIQPEGEDLAVVGSVELPAGRAFTLHAVVRGLRRNGESVYYTEAKRLRIAGQEIAPANLEPWPGSQPVKVRWFTVEGSRPLLQLSKSADLSAFRMDEMIRPDWPLAWQIPGSIRSALELDAGVAYGLQRYHVRVELYQEERDMLPKQVIRSWGARDLKTHLADFPTVIARLPGPLATVSGYFGLTHLEVPPDADPALLEQVAELATSQVAISRTSLLSAHLAPEGRGWDELRWQEAPIDGSFAWADPKAPAAAELVAVAPGDLLRVGDRVAILMADTNGDGRLDADDHCFDFSQGLEMRRVGEVFTGTAEYASLNPEAPSPPPALPRPKTSKVPTAPALPKTSAEPKTR